MAGYDNKIKYDRSTRLRMEREYAPVKYRRLTRFGVSSGILHVVSVESLDAYRSKRSQP